MERLQTEVMGLIEQLPKEKHGEAENVAENLEDVIKQAGKEKPSADKFAVSAKGLLEAAGWVAGFAGKIGATLLALGKLAHGAGYVAADAWLIAEIRRGNLKGSGVIS